MPRKFKINCSLKNKSILSIMKLKGQNHRVFHWYNYCKTFKFHFEFTKFQFVLLIIDIIILLPREKKKTGISVNLELLFKWNNELKLKKNHISDHFKIRNKNWSSVFTKKSLKMYQGRWMFFNLTEIWVLKNILIWYCILKFSGESCSTIMSVWNPVFRTEDNGVERRLPHYDCWRFCIADILQRDIKIS